MLAVTTPLKLHLKHCLNIKPNTTLKCVFHAIKWEYRLSLHQIHASSQRTVYLETDLHILLQSNETVLNWKLELSCLLYFNQLFIPCHEPYKLLTKYKRSLFVFIDGFVCWLPQEWPMMKCFSPGLYRFTISKQTLRIQVPSLRLDVLRRFFTLLVKSLRFINSWLTYSNQFWSSDHEIKDCIAWFLRYIFKHNSNKL